MMKRLMTAILAFGLGVSAVQANDYRYAGPKPRVIERSVELNSRVRNERLPLRKILDIGPQFRGKHLKGVDLEIRPRGRTTRFLLLADGHVIGEAWSGRGDRFVSIQAFDRAKIGVDFKRLQLAVEGRARIGRLAARIGEGRREVRHKQRHDFKSPVRTRSYQKPYSDGWRIEYRGFFGK